MNHAFKGINELNIEEVISKPPSSYSQTSLISMLEKLEIGRPSTYATMVTINVDRGYVTEDKNRKLKLTSKGQVVAELIGTSFKDLINTDFTKQMEIELDEISKNKSDYKKYLTEFWEFLKNLIERTSFSKKK